MKTLGSPNITFLSEFLPTLITVVWLLFCMKTLISSETTLMTEYLSTLLTVLRLLSFVNMLGDFVRVSQGSHLGNHQYVHKGEAVPL